MAMTVTILCTLNASGEGVNRRKLVVGKVVGDSSYASNGEALVAADFGLSVIESMVSIGGGCVTGGGDTGRVLSWDRTAGKAVVLQAGTADSPLNDSDSADDLSTTFFDVLVVGY